MHVAYCKALLRELGEATDVGGTVESFRTGIAECIYNTISLTIYHLQYDVTI